MLVTDPGPGRTDPGWPNMESKPCDAVVNLTTHLGQGRRWGLLKCFSGFSRPGSLLSLLVGGKPEHSCHLKCTSETKQTLYAVGY